MSQEKLAQYIRKWGNTVSYVRHADAVPTVVGSETAIWEFLEVMRVEKVARASHPRFTRHIKPFNARFWRWDADILSAETLNGTKLHKFSWNPVTGEFLLIATGNHADAKGQSAFDDYVRGIVLPERKLVTFRPFYPKWMQNRSVVQRFHDEGDATEETSYDAQYAAEQALKLEGSKGWSFQYNINNRMLEEMTGTHRW